MCRVLKKGNSMYVDHLLCRDDLNSMHDDAADIVIADPLRTTTQCGYSLLVRDSM